MSEFSASMTVGQVVALNPLTSRVFEARGLDYCCGGKRPLAEACAAKGIDVAAVLAELSAVGERPEGETDWAAATMTELADHIEQTHHGYLKRELPRMGAMLRKVAAVHGDHHPELATVLDVYTGFSEELVEHMMKEERVLFPWLRRLDAGERWSPAPGASVAGPVARMIQEHDDAGEALAQMRELSGGFTPPDDACGTYRALYASLAELERDMHQHVHKENNILFPRGLSAELAAAGNGASSGAACVERGSAPRQGGHCGCHSRINT